MSPLHVSLNHDIGTLEFFKQIVRDTGLRPAIVRTIQASRAGVETARDVLMELNAYRNAGGTAKVLW